MKHTVGTVRANRQNERRHRQPRLISAQQIAPQSPGGGEENGREQNREHPRGILQAQPTDDDRVKRREQGVSVLGRVLQVQVMGQCRVESCERLHGVDTRVLSETLIPVSEQPEDNQHQGQRDRDRRSCHQMGVRLTQTTPSVMSTMPTHCKRRQRFAVEAPSRQRQQQIKGASDAGRGDTQFHPGHHDHPQEVPEALDRDGGTYPRRADRTQDEFWQHGERRGPAQRGNAAFEQQLSEHGIDRDGNDQEFGGHGCIIA